MSANPPTITPPTRPLRAGEIEVLESIYAHRLLTTHQLWELHTPAGETRDPSWMRHIVAHLRRRGLVRSTRWRGDRQLRCWYVTEAGADTIEAVTTRLRSRRVLLTADGAAGMHQSHTLAVNDVGIAFATWAKTLGHECGHLAWENEVAHRIGDGNRGVRGGDLLVADAMLHYAALVGGRTTLLYRFVELDRATMSVQELGEKLRRYVTYETYVPRDAHDGRPAWQQRYPGMPGVVLVLTGKPRRLLERRRAMLFAVCHLDPTIREAIDQGRAPSVSVVLLEDLQREGPFAGVFLRPGAPDTPVNVIGRPVPATGTKAS
ncbi:MAG: replication-relaxation family protein [Egibacteraceae bacterium]